MLKIFLDYPISCQIILHRLTKFTVYSKLMLIWKYDVGNSDNIAISMSSQECQLLSSFLEFFNDFIWDIVLDNHVVQSFQGI